MQVGRTHPGSITRITMEGGARSAEVARITHGEETLKDTRGNSATTRAREAGHEGGTSSREAKVTWAQTIYMSFL